MSFGPNKRNMDKMTVIERINSMASYQTASQELLIRQSHYGTRSEMA